jgi:NADH-quinone oxidoreductase subunit L
MTISTICLVIALAPLLGAVIAGFFRNQIGRVGAHWVTIVLVFVSFLLSLYIAKLFLIDGHEPYYATLYTWASGGDLFPFDFKLGFLIDSLTSMMLLVVTFVSFLVHVYSVGYMSDDDGYQRFFSYISLFTFAMLMLVTSNNFLQLFFGWEGVGLVSYLLIGFYYKRQSAIASNIKAFLVNRVGDFGFILGIALLLTYSGSLDYATVFKQASQLSTEHITLFSGHSWSLLSVVCICLFVGAMGKSAQMPLHIWLPESMEGPTPISALIHAATMVTAGVFMVARMSPLFELSDTALEVVMVIGGTGALFTGILGVVMNDIKRVIAYSTLSQLGYMMVGMGTSAYSAGIFHLTTHACFKALLFLGAGSVIMAMHHEQDMRKMGGLWRKMPVTYITMLIGGLALCAIPPFSGFYSKDSIIEAAKLTNLPGGAYTFFCVAAGAMVTSLYTFRLIFMTFHGKPRMDEHTKAHLKESPWVVLVPLIGLAIPSLFLGYPLLHKMLFAKPSLLSDAITVLPQHDVLARFPHDETYPWHMTLHAFVDPVFWLAVSGIVIMWLSYIVFPAFPPILAQRFSIIYRILLNKFGFDLFNEKILIPLTKGFGRLFYGVGDKILIDGLVVNGVGRIVKFTSRASKGVQSGYINHYMAAMVFGLLVLLVWLILG